MYSSPNHVVWEYFRSLRFLENEARNAPSPDLARQHAALAIVMSVTAVEVFLNLWFRVRVEQAAKPTHIASLQKQLAERKSIEFKLKNWPTQYLGKTLDLTHGPGAEFAETKRIRNAIVHFSSTHETIDLGAHLLHGLADTSEYDGLTHIAAKRALSSAEGLVAEVFRLAGLTPLEVTNSMHGWAGKIAV